MKVAVENIAAIKAEKKILMLGAMMELGEESEAEHHLIENISQHNWNQVILVGGDFGKLPHPFSYFDTSEAAAKWVQQHHLEDSYILIKGSRSIQMEKIAEVL